MVVAVAVCKETAFIVRLLGARVLVGRLATLIITMLGLHHHPVTGKEARRSPTAFPAEGRRLERHRRSGATTLRMFRRNTAARHLHHECVRMLVRMLLVVVVVVLAPVVQIYHCQVCRIPSADVTVGI